MVTVRQAWRHLLRRRTATLLSIGLLGLGVGLAASFYSVLDRALLRGLPFPDGERLVAFSTRDAAGWPMPLDDYRAIKQVQRSFEWTAPLRTFVVTVTRGAGTQGLIGSYVTADLLPRLGVEPMLGRGFETADEDPTRPPVALISHRLWHGSYGGDPTILGETVVINREPTVVIGILPAGFQFPLRHDVWGILRPRGRDWSDSFVFGIGLLAEGVSTETAREDLARVVAILDEASPQQQPRFASLESYVRANIGDRSGSALRAMVFAALGLLLLTCANLANLRLSETLRRRRELDTRLAIGAGALGLVRMLLVESLLIGLWGGGLALAVAWALTTLFGRTLLAGSALERTYWVQAGLDASLVVLALGVTLAATLVGALAPVISTLAGAHRRALSWSASPPRRSWWTRALVGAQVAVCFALLVAAGLFGARVHLLLDHAPGFRTDHLSSLTLSTYQAELDQTAERRDFFERFQRALGAEPEITSAAFASSAPWSFTPERTVSATTDGASDRTAKAKVVRVSAPFFETMDLSLLAGRPFAPADFETEPDDSDLDREQRVAANDDTETRSATRPSGPVAAILSRSLANRLFEASPVERRMSLAGSRPSDAGLSLRVVGVVADLDIERADAADRNLQLYLPDDRASSSFLIARTVPGLSSARPAVEKVLSRVAPRVALRDELRVDDAIASSVWIERRLGQIFSLFGIAALLLTVIGMYAVMAVMVRGRERELGLRAAIGARPRDLRKLVLAESTRQLALGLGLGASACWAAYRWLDSEVVVDAFRGASTWQLPLALASAAVVAACCLIASWGPASRAAGADPVRYLRSE